MLRGERCVAFFAETPTPENEERAFREAWAYFEALDRAVVYYYSKHERTRYRRLRERYPHVCEADAIEALFTRPRSVDLYYDVVLPKTVWPTKDYSIKTLASHLGFAWRDAHPSGAASIEWYHRWVEEGDPAVRKRLLEYNEDDCRATRVLLDGIRRMAGA